MKRKQAIRQALLEHYKASHFWPSLRAIIEATLEKLDHEEDYEAEYAFAWQAMFQADGASLQSR